MQDFWSEAVNRRVATLNWDIWAADTVALQSEYNTPPNTSTTVGAEWIESVSVNYDGLTYTETGLLKYIPCRYATDAEIANWNYHLENQSNLKPIYFERDSSIFIAPDPRTSQV